MGYVKKTYREIFNKLDNCSEFPKGWDNFVNKQAVKQNLIIKSNKNKCFCTNCYHNFISTKKINETVKCPYCHNTYLIKRSNLRYYDFKDYLSILDRINNTFIIRYFELKSIIDANHEQISSVVEFAREIPTDNYYRDVFVNERVAKCQCHIYIYHHLGYYMDDNKWREYTRNYSLIDYSIVFPNNIKKLLIDTEFKYSCIWDIVKHCEYIDLLDLIKDKNENSIKRIELLAKMKLYNLALREREFLNGGNFNTIFGVSKDYYQFMKRNNITYVQLKLLRMLQEKDIKKIKYLEHFISYGENIDNLEEIANYIPINRFIKYTKLHHRKVDVYMYKDYLRFASVLGLDLKNNRYAFPKDLKATHDKLEAQYEINSKRIINNAIKKRGKLLSKYIYKNKQFIVFPAKSVSDLVNESRQQNNCVRTYTEKYADGTCDIYFLRNIDTPKKSLVTVEVRNNEVVQSRIKNNYSTTKEQDKFLNLWEQKVLKGVA